MMIQVLALVLGTALSTPFAIENTTVHVGNGEVLENTTVVVADGKIKYISERLINLQDIWEESRKSLEQKKLNFIENLRNEHGIT